MKIHYSNKHLKSQFFMGISFFIGGFLIYIITLLFNISTIFSLHSVGIGLAIAGLFSLCIYAYDKSKQYMTINFGILTKNSFFPKKLLLSDIIRLKDYAGDYILSTSTTQLTIRKELIEPASLTKLRAELKKYNNIEWS